MSQFDRKGCSDWDEAIVSGFCAVSAGLQGLHERWNVRWRKYPKLYYFHARWLVKPRYVGRSELFAFSIFCRNQWSVLEDSHCEALDSWWNSGDRCSPALNLFLAIDLAERMWRGGNGPPSRVVLYVDTAATACWRLVPAGCIYV